MKTVAPRNHEDPLEILRRCGGYYECPKDVNGQRLGPLVGYAGPDQKGRQYVGDVYVNFAKAERHLPVLRYLAETLAIRVGDRTRAAKLQRATGFCAAPEGGKALA